MQADTEHQQHDTDFGEFGSNIDVTHKSGCCRRNNNTGEQVTDQCRYFDAFHEEAERPGNRKTDRQGRNQAKTMTHR